MQKSILILILTVLLVQVSNAQCPLPTFSIPDSICSGAPFQIVNTPDPSLTYEWDLCIGDLKKLPTGKNIGNNTLVGAYMVKAIIENGNRYLFISDRFGNSLKRYDFGTSYDNIPTVHNYGNVGNLIIAPIGLEVIQQNGNWYVFLTGTGNTNLIRVNLGNSIPANIATGTNLGGFGFNAPRGLKAITDGTNHFLFSANSSGDILTRIDFGSSYGNAPINFTNFSNPEFAGGIGLDIAYDCLLDKYVGFYSSISQLKISQIDFGNSLTNTPTIAASILVPNAIYNIQLIRDANNWHLMATLSSSIGGIIRNLSFGNNLLSTPVVVSSDTVGAVGGPFGSSFIRDSSTFYGFSTSATPVAISVIKWPAQCNSSPVYSNDPTGPIVSLSGFGYYPFSMIATDTNGFQYTFVDSVYLSPAPTSFYTSSSGCEGLPVQFNDSSIIGSGTIDSWLWDFGDGSPTSSLEDPIHTFIGTGTFTVTLTTESNTGCENVYSSLITINPNPVADFSFLNNQCQNTEVTFNDLSQVSGGNSVVEWIWNFGDGTDTSGLQNPIHTYINTGTYTIQLNIESDAGCRDSIFQDITIIPSPETDFIVSSTCVGESVVFTNLTSIQGGGSILYDWDFGDSNGSTQTSPVYQYAATAGNYDVTLLATASNGCTDTLIENLRISNRPIPQFTWTPTIVCQGNQVSFTNSSTGIGADTILTYLWDFGGQGNSSLENPVFAFPDTGFYDVTLIALSPTDCDSSLTQQVYVIPSPVASFSAGNVCLNNTTFFNPSVATPSGTVVDSIIWDFGDGTLLNSIASPSHNYLTADTFIVSMTVYNDLLCIGFYSDTVVVYPLPTADFVVPLVCTGAITEFDGTTSSVIDDIVTGWLWNFDGLGNSSDSIAQFTFQTPGNYDVTLIATTSHGCSDTVTITVSAIQSPDFTFIFNEPCLGTAAGFTYLSNIIPEPPSNLLWNFGDGTLSSTLSPSHVYTMSGNFNVTLFVTNPNTGCSTTDSNQIFIKPVPEPGFDVMANCEDQPFPFTDTSQVQSGSLVAWNWNFGALGSSIIQNPVITPTVGGSYPVTLSVTSDQGCIASVTDTLIVFKRPEAAFVPDPIFGSPPLPVNFINTTIGATIFTWDFGDGTTGTGLNPTHLYPDTGTYFVTMIATSSEGCLDTANSTVAVLIPYLDLAITNIYTTIENNKLKLSAQLTNQGNLTITEFIIKGTIENGSIISEKWEGNFVPGGVFVYEFVSSYEISDSYTLRYYCIEATDINNSVDQNLSNNKLCSSINTEFEIFNVFPNPFDTELSISFSLNSEGSYQIDIYDEIGKLVVRKENFIGLKGFNTKTINTQNLSKGYYTVSLRFRDETRIYKALKVNNN